MPIVVTRTHLAGKIRRTGPKDKRKTLESAGQLLASGGQKPYVPLCQNERSRDPALQEEGIEILGSQSQSHCRGLEKYSRTEAIRGSAVASVRGSVNIPERAAELT
jgi:hypothetical protein